MLNVGKVTFC